MRSIKPSQADSILSDEEHSNLEETEQEELPRFPVPISQPYMCPYTIHDWGLTGGYNPLILKTPRKFNFFLEILF